MTIQTSTFVQKMSDDNGFAVYTRRDDVEYRVDVYPPGDYQDPDDNNGFIMLQEPRMTATDARRYAVLLLAAAEFLEVTQAAPPPPVKGDST